MKILAIETATEACSAALNLDGEIVERHIIEPRGHARLILPMMDALLAEAGMVLPQLDALAFGRGPGSFTGVRIAAAVVQGAAFAAQRPVVAVSTLAALAQGASERYADGRMLAALDARMQEVYWGAYIRGEGGLVRLEGKEGVHSPSQVPIPQPGDWIGVGPGWSAYGAMLRERLHGRIAGSHGEMLPRASHVALLAAASLVEGHAVSAEHALPVYLRDTVAKKAIRRSR